MKRVEQKICQRNLIAAYVDGELGVAATAIFEQHVEDCAECRTELRAHRMFVCELDAALTGKVELPVPDDFSKMIAAATCTAFAPDPKTRKPSRFAVSLLSLDLRYLERLHAKLSLRLREPSSTASSASPVFSRVLLTTRLRVWS